MIAKLTTQKAIAKADADAYSTASTGIIDVKKGERDDADEEHADAVTALGSVATTPSTGLLKAEEDAEADYDAQYDIVNAAVTGTQTIVGTYAASGTGHLGTLYGLRATANSAWDDLTDALADLDAAIEVTESTEVCTVDGESFTTTIYTPVGTIPLAEQEVATKLALHLAAVVDCKIENYNKYKETLILNEGARSKALDDIREIVETAEANAPEPGAAGYRCEKALSNGTFRPARGDTTCNAELCCGAARIPVGEATMTIETCQAKDTT